MGVDVFFALSGFLITSLILNEFDATGGINFARFFSHRWFRLAPALIAMLMIYGLILILFVPDATFEKQGVATLLALTYTTNWARAWTIKESADLGHTWSLAVEGQFYLLWPFIVWTLLTLIRNKWVLCITFIGLAVLSFAVRLWWLGHGATIERVYNGLDTRFETLVWGAVLAAYLRTRKNELNVNLGWPALAIMGCLFCMAQWTSVLYYQAGITGVGVLAALLVNSLNTVKVTQFKRAFEFSWLVWLGSVSYGVYLWHFPVVRLLLNFDIQGASLVGAVLCITLPVAALSYYYLELPLQRWNKQRASLSR